MKEWLKTFWNSHGDRLIFMGLSFIIAITLFIFVPEMREESKTIIIGVMMLLYNKSRSKKE